MRPATLLLAGALGFGLAGDRAAAQEGPVRLEARPEAVRVTVGESARLDVVALDARGRVVPAAIRVGGPRSALLYDDGRVQGLEPGRHELVATLVQGPGSDAPPVTLTVPVTVEWPPIARVAVEPAEEGRLYQGARLRFRARALHADGSPRPDVRPVWSSTDPAVATVDGFGVVTAVSPGQTRLTAVMEGVRGEVPLAVGPLPATELRLEGGRSEARTGDVLTFRAVLLDDQGLEVPDMPLTWASTLETTDFEHIAASAPARVQDGRFVADIPGLYTVVATAGPLTARASVRVRPRDAVRDLDVVGHGLTQQYRTTDLWVFAGADGRDYALTGSKAADGHAFLFDVTDPGEIVKVDSLQVDARTVNDVKVSPDGRYAALSREGASDRRNGVVILDLSTLPRLTVASTYDEGLTGGVHNMFATDTHLFALSGGDKYVILDVTDVYNPRYVSEYNHPDSRIHDVLVRDGLAYSAEWGTGVVVVDVGDGRWGGSIDHPVLVTTYRLPTGRTHAVFPYRSASTDRTYVFVGDELMNRRGLAWAGYPRSMGSYRERFDPETGVGGIPLATTGYIQVLDFTDPEHPEMVARYEVSEFGTHNLWVEDDVLYVAYYEGGVRAVDVSGELLGNLYTQGREMAVFKPAHPLGYVPNAPMVWGVQPFKGHVFLSDTNSGLWAVRIHPPARPVS